MAARGRSLCYNQSMKKQGVSFFAGIDTLLGWYGMAAILAAYILISFNILEAKSLVYQIMNLTGALGLAVISLKKKDYQPALLNMIWSMVACVLLIGMLIKL